MKKFVVVLCIVSVALFTIGPVAFAAEESNMGAALLSFFLGAGTGEWLVHKASFGSCLLEHLFSFIPIIGTIAWVGSIIDAYHGVGGAGESRANLFFTTINL
jgi:hypothetical protein